MAVKLYVRGVLKGEFESRARAIVACFENGLTYDQHSRKRNQLLPGVRLESVTDDLCNPSFNRLEHLSGDNSHVLRKKPERGSLDDRGRNTHRDLVKVNGKWRRI